ncbi:hypothetical protein Q1695_014745 [Nippostrongylus brasiliensis]|nr:hypothetical protein Q1695_014745 [Nippostrongylus brasiliensis]
MRCSKLLETTELGDIQLANFGKPIALSEEQIKTDVVDKFLFTAKFASEQGFDGVQIHGAHGYLLSSFLSPTTNNRMDKYGGSVENRFRVIREIYDAIRKEIDTSTGFLVGIKMNSVEYQNRGLGIEDAKAIAELVEKCGFDFVELSGGTYEQSAFMHKRESTRKREAFFLEFAEQLRPCFEKTVVYLTGGFRTAPAMVRAIADKATDGIGLGRPITAEPAPDTKLDPDNFQLALQACLLQMAQMGKHPLSELRSVCDEIADLSHPDEAENFKKAIDAHSKKMEEAAKRNEILFRAIDYKNIVQ